MRKRLTPIIESAWARDPFALGSYSYGSPGAQAARAALAAPVNDRLFFAGEHCSDAGFFHRARRLPHRREGGRGRGQGAASSAGVTAGKP